MKIAVRDRSAQAIASSFSYQSDSFAHLAHMKDKVEPRLRTSSSKLCGQGMLAEDPMGEGSIGQANALIYKGD